MMNKKKKMMNKKKKKKIKLKQIQINVNSNNIGEFDNNCKLLLASIDLNDDDKILLGSKLLKLKKMKKNLKMITRVN